ncbi:(2Fe-2S)-binding protein [Intrasporangium sp. YIM S08009]|uniref:(2Fe-2S)-binding protein n=1 Tax=Intrasporangium zincisolvens TaxID=3080018 RepID=UPI002B0571DA|nr:(2Fe-2S)-binding protein [Intrasporangium sp. YIM S08009]
MDGPEAQASGDPRDEAAAVLDVLRRVDRALPFTTVTPDASVATTWCADVLAHVRAGADPLAPWREALRGQMERRHGVPVAPHVPAAFVLQWWCEVAATPVAQAAALGPWVLAPEASGLGFELAPGLYPHRVVVDPARTTVAVEPDAGRRASRARDVYEGLVHDVVEAFAPEVRIGSRQRWGVVEDMWAGASRLAAGAAGHATGPEPRRVSCCFIYALPGMRECAACPRGGSPAAHR